MADLLKKSCVELSIKLKYTNNKITVLSSGIHNNEPILRVHRIFKNCSEEIINAIIGFYSGLQNQYDYLKIIEDYVREHFLQKKYKILSPDEAFKSILIKKVMPVNSNQNDDSSLVELDIASITSKNFFGDSSNIKPGDSIQAQDGDITELDIIIDTLKVK